MRATCKVQGLAIRWMGAATVALGLFYILATPADAQIIINPTRIHFDSPDHEALLPSGEPVITHYIVEVWRRDNNPASGTPVAMLELGKPAPTSGSSSISAYVATFILGLTSGIDYVATVVAVGPAGASRSPLSNDFTRLNGPTPPSPPVVTDPANEIVIHAGDVQPAHVHGRWALVADSSAAGGVALHNSNRGDPKPSTALASPANYVDFTFTAAAGVPYRFWMRMRALNNFYGNDSVIVQFTNSVDGNNVSRYRVGSTDGAPVILEEGTGAGIAGWGWNDHGWGVLADPIYFSTSGPQVIRIQQREDGVFFDQIILSAGQFVSRSPGSLKNDAVIVPKQ